MSDKVTETFTSEDDVRYALIRVLLSSLAKNQRCSCCLPVRCVLCTAMISLGFEAWPLGLETWPDQDYRGRNELRELLRSVRTKSGLWRNQMSELADDAYARLRHEPERWARLPYGYFLLTVGELDIPDTEQRDAPEPTDGVTEDGSPA